MLGIATDGTWSVAAGALTYGYLWNEIRTKGGAYGCWFRSAIDRQVSFSTYRDPAIDPTLKRIAQAGSWLKHLKVDHATLEGYIVSTVSGLDAPLKPYALTKRRNAAYFGKRPRALPRAGTRGDARLYREAPARTRRRRDPYRR